MYVSFVIKIFVLFIFERPLMTGFTVASIQHKVQFVACGYSENSNHCASSLSDQNLSFPTEGTLDPSSAHRRLIRLGICSVGSESSMGAHAILYLCWTLSYSESRERYIRIIMKVSS